MDRASGSGVFARDPDALIDLIELDVTDAVRKAETDQETVKLCARYLDRNAMNWRDEVSQDDACVAYKLVETKSPEGYVLKDGAFYFWVRTDKNQTQPSQCPSDFSGSMVEVGGTLLAANDKNAEGDYSLPETGGLGTLLYVIGGLILMAGSGYLLYRKNRDGRGAL